jgi:hypothetical protein
MFRFAALKFWNTLERPHRCLYANPELLGDLAYAEALCTKLGHFIAGRRDLLLGKER